MRCDYCGYEWIAVSPTAATQLECPGCRRMNRVIPTGALEVKVLASDLARLVRVVRRVLSRYHEAESHSNERFFLARLLGPEADHIGRLLADIDTE